MATRLPGAAPAAIADDGMGMEDDFGDSEMLDDDTAVDGYRIIIEVSGAGDLRVGTEPMPMERLPEDDPTADMDRIDPMSGMKPVGTIREALTEALDVYRARGDLTGAELENEAFDSGFGAEMKRNGLERR